VACLYICAVVLCYNILPVLTMWYYLFFILFLRTFCLTRWLYYLFWLIDWLIDWCLTSTLIICQLFRGMSVYMCGSIMLQYSACSDDVVLLVFLSILPFIVFDTLIILSPVFCILCIYLHPYTCTINRVLYGWQHSICWNYTLSRY
jgi:hypothetical protein